jgi:hypothetical protein
MEPASATDQIVLVAGPGPELLAVLMVLTVSVAGAAVGLIMARRGKVEAWSLVGIFGLLMLGSVVALAHLPTRLALDRNGVELGFWSLREQRAWSDIAAINVRRGRFGLWVSVTTTGGGPKLLSFWSKWPGLYAPAASFEPRQIAMRIDAWRLAGGR